MVPWPGKKRLESWSQQRSNGRRKRSNEWTLGGEIFYGGFLGVHGDLQGYTGDFMMINGVSGWFHGVLLGPNHMYLDVCEKIGIKPQTTILIAPAYRDINRVTIKFEGTLLSDNKSIF